MRRRGFFACAFAHTLWYTVPSRADPPGRSLFDGKTLRGWKVPSFGGDGAVRVVKGAIRLTDGDPMTGVTWAGDPVPRMDYQLSFAARRVSGGDFFATVTFPVAEAFCSLVLGGWGGTLVGLSSLDGQDASENETSRRVTFVDGRWYGVRVQVEDARIRAWLDDAPVVDVATRGRKISIRPEVELNRPLGFSTWRTTGEVRAITTRLLG